MGKETMGKDSMSKDSMSRDSMGKNGMKQFLALHPKPAEKACDPETTSCPRHRMAMLSRGLLDPHHGYVNADLNDFVARFPRHHFDCLAHTAHVA